MKPKIKKERIVESSEDSDLDIDDVDLEETIQFLEEEMAKEMDVSSSEEDSEQDRKSPKRKRKAPSKKKTDKKKPKSRKATSDTDYSDAESAQSEDEKVEEEYLTQSKGELSEEEKEKNKKKKKSKPRRREKKDVYVLEECELDDKTLEKNIKWGPVESETPDQISDNVKMLKFQLEAITWMGQQEENPRWRGGILADDMGMGKTLQAIALLLKRKAPEDSKVRATLVVCPVVALTQWQNEIEKYTKPNSLKVTVYHGNNRITDGEELVKYDVILTSYSVIETEYRHQQTGYKRKGELIKKDSLLHSVEYYRIILDEAHSIKDRNCNTAKAAFNLNATYRWCLSGTPLTNRIGELHSLVKFLRVTPYSYFYCKKCDCKSLKWDFPPGSNMGRKCLQCDHTCMSHFSWWNKNVMNPIAQHGMGGPKSDRAIKVLKHILQQLMIRRTKIEKAEDMHLPPRNIVIRKDQLDEEENDFYEALYTQSQTTFNNFVKEGTILNNYAHVFDLLLRLRQAVDHPYLVLHSKDRDTDTGDEWCGVCHELAEDPIISKCKHVFCRPCIENYVKLGTQPSCPTCFIPLTIDLKQKTYETKSNKEKKGKTILQRIDLSNWRTSTKIEAVMEELIKIRSRDPNAKTLIFSQFVNFLDLIEWRLKLGAFGCVKLDGRMNSAQKDAAIDKFSNDPNTSIFLISLKAGGVALNLTAASNCFLLDPWWNPAVEFQAIDRIYRLGQYKCINVVRFIIPNTIEDRIMRLQEKKQLLFHSTVGMDQDALARLTVDDFKFLFRA